MITTYQTIVGFMSAHPLLCTGVAFFALTCIDQMPEPTPGKSGFYLWAYNVLHVIAARFTKLQTVNGAQIVPQIAAKINNAKGANGKTGA